MSMFNANIHIKNKTLIAQRVTFTNNYAFLKQKELHL